MCRRAPWTDRPDAFPLFPLTGVVSLNAAPFLAYFVVIEFPLTVIVHVQLSEDASESSDVAWTSANDENTIRRTTDTAAILYFFVPFLIESSLLLEV